MSQPVTPRRTTRSSASASASPSSPPESKLKPSPRRQLLAASAAASKEESSLDAILEELPGRRAQAMDLLRLLAAAPALPLLLHGGAATGKTRALLLALRHLRPSPRIAYAALRSLPSPRALFASLLSQLNPPSSSTSSRQRLPEKPSDFVAALRDVLGTPHPFQFPAEDSRVETRESTRQQIWPPGLQIRATDTWYELWRLILRRWLA